MISTDINVDNYMNTDVNVTVISPHRKHELDGSYITRGVLAYSVVCLCRPTICWL